ncbi:MAG: adenylate kinase family protein [Acidimicrobiia bacterium]
MVLVLGCQGAGKGVQCARLASRLPADHVSTGDLLRLAIRAGSTLGRAVEPYVAAGDLVPDELVVDLVANRLDQDRRAGWAVVLDGFPRTRRQASLLVDAAGRIDLALHLSVPRALALERLSLRVVCLDCGLPGTAARCPACGGDTERRADDTPDAIERRLATFDSETGPLIEWLEARDLLVHVDGTGTPDAVSARLMDTVRARLGSGEPDASAAGIHR